MKTETKSDPDGEGALVTIEHERVEFARLKLTEDEVDQHGGHGLSVATIDVARPDGRVARFFVRLYRTNQGRIHAELSSPLRTGHNATRKSVAGCWLDYEARHRETVAKIAKDEAARKRRLEL